MRKSVVDVGSNSVLLVVEERTESGWRMVDETSEVSALGVGTRETGLLSEEGMGHTLAALVRAFARSQELGSAPPIAAATMAARIATNTPDFLARAAAQGTPVQILSGEDEAELGFRAVADDPIFAEHPRLSIIDIGGQSTEIVTADREPSGWNVRFRRSYALGTLALKGSVLAPDSPGPGEILAAVTEIDDRIGLTYRRGEAGYAIGLGATGTNLVSMRDGLATWQPVRIHGAWLSFEEVSRTVGRLMPMTPAERRAIVGIEPGREGTIQIGALILERALQALGVMGCGVSVRGWRHALLETGMPEYEGRPD